MTCRLADTPLGYSLLHAIAFYLYRLPRCPVEKLDTILKIFLKEGATPKQSIASAKLLIYGFTQTPLSQIESVVDKLVKDGYIKEIKYNGSPSDYTITFEGEALIELGGYTSLSGEAQKVKELQRISGEREKTIVFLTKVLAFGTTIAAVYYLIEIAKTLFPCWFAKP